MQDGIPGWTWSDEPPQSANSVVCIDKIAPLEGSQLDKVRVIGLIAE